jgi:hypothetical protein
MSILNTEKRQSPLTTTYYKIPTLILTTLKIKYNSATHFNRATHKVFKKLTVTCHNLPISSSIRLELVVTHYDLAIQLFCGQLLFNADSYSLVNRWPWIA